MTSKTLQPNLKGRERLNADRGDLNATLHCRKTVRRESHRCRAWLRHARRRLHYVQGRFSRHLVLRTSTRAGGTGRVFAGRRPAYEKGSKVWRFEDLPIYPKNWKLLPKNDKGVKKQLATIGKLLKKASLVVHAGDPDREGQLLVDEVLEHFRYTGRVQRFWVSAQDSASIRKGLTNLRDNETFDGMRLAALGRSRADWLLGMNLSRAYTLARQAQGKKELIAVRSRADVDARPGRET